MNEIEEDCLALRPTVLGGTPSFFQAFEREFAADAARRGKNTAVQEWNTRLGNRAKLCVIGGAASSASTKDFIRSVLNITVIDGYGSSEVGGLASNAVSSSAVKLQLIDVPHLGWRASDGKGEIVANTGKRMILG